MLHRTICLILQSWSYFFTSTTSGFSPPVEATCTSQFANCCSFLRACLYFPWIRVCRQSDDKCCSINGILEIGVWGIIGCLWMAELGGSHYNDGVCVGFERFVMASVWGADYHLVVTKTVLIKRLVIYCGMLEGIYCSCLSTASSWSFVTGYSFNLF